MCVRLLMGLAWPGAGMEEVRGLTLIGTSFHAVRRQWR